MATRFERDGVAFQYPENWQLVPEEYEAGWGVSLFSPGTAFLSITLDTSGAGPGEVADTALVALREEYPQLDAEPVSSSLAHLPAVGHDVEFITLDLTNSCEIRGIAIGRGVLLVYWQASDLETQNQQVIRAICQALTIAEDD